MKEFNTTAVCIPSKHYMVDITERVKEIKKMVDAGKYFTINRARQYGKTTTLRALQQALSADYVVLNLSFELISSNGFQTEASFVQAFSRLLHDRYEFFGLSIPDKILSELNDFIRPDSDKLNLDELYRLFRKWIISSDKPIVMLIDEVDNASNNQVFVDFLGMLRGGYISREAEDGPAFQSVILAGVTDIKYLKSKIRSENQHRVNSPWNIAADFDIDMSLSREGIAGMLTEYEADHHTGMDIPKIAALLRDYTNGYPFLVSRICQLIDVEVGKKMSLPDAWTQRGFDEAVKMLLVESNTLFQSLTGKLTNNPELKDSLRSILMEGERVAFNRNQEDIALLDMYGFIRNDEGAVRIDNRIFETVLYNLFLSDEEMKNSVFSREGQLAKNQFVKGGKLDMRLIMERFIVTYTQVFGPLENRFKEKDGRELFLLYMRPIINGTGNYYIEAQTRDQTRTDVVVDYLGEQYIIELKIWRGERYNAEGEQQISEYLDYFGLTTG
ncbi:MAG: AAA-like domain-containing protein, partial [Anaerolineaceae bacterium]|nr:AAA-like domain-containing protein [Anaerolineaceae bacterium]